MSPKPDGGCDGCVSGGSCYTSSEATCGVGGVTCVACDASQTCSPQGQCLSGPTGGGAGGGTGGGTGGGSGGGTGGVTDAGTGPGLSGDTGGLRIAKADFNGDGVADVVFANGSSSIVSVFAGTGTGFAAANEFPSGVGAVEQLAVANVAGDSRPDIIVVPVDGTKAPVVFVSNGTGTTLGFGPATAFPIPAITQFVHGIAALDYDRNGVTDLAVTVEATSPASTDLWHGDGAGGFTHVAQLESTTANGGFRAVYQLVTIADSAASYVGLVTPNGFDYSVISPSGSIDRHPGFAGVDMARRMVSSTAPLTGIAVREPSGYLDFRTPTTVPSVFLRASTARLVPPDGGVDSLLRILNSTDFVVSDFRLRAGDRIPSVASLGVTGLEVVPFHHPDVASDQYYFGPSAGVTPAPNVVGLIAFDVTGDGKVDLVEVVSGSPRVVRVIAGK